MSLPSDPVQINVPAPPPVNYRRDDGLDPARGIVHGVLVSAGLWAVLALVAWFCLIYFNVHV